MLSDCNQKQLKQLGFNQIRAITNMTDQICATLLERESGESRAALPVCLPPWLENPYRLVSLWDVLQISAEKYVEMGRLFQDWMSGPMLIALPDQSLDEQTFEDFKESLVAMRLHCAELELRVTERLFANTVRGIGGKQITRRIAADAMGEIYRCFVAEMAAQAFFFMPGHRAKYYSDLRIESPKQGGEQTVSLFGEMVDRKFSSARYDIREAGNCYAVGRNTGCVFHLMCVLEIGLTALGMVFDVSLAHTNWAPALDQIESRIRNMQRDAAWKVQPDCKEQQKFYAQAASHFGVLKDAWRNHTMHARGRYDEGEAEAILRNVQGFMQKLATRLHE